MSKANFDYKCPFPTCGGTWTPKVLNPKACPICKKYFRKDKQPIRVPRQHRQKLLRKVDVIKPEEKVLFTCPKCNRQVPILINLDGKTMCADCAANELKSLARLEVPVKKTLVEEVEELERRME